MLQTTGCNNMKEPESAATQDHKGSPVNVCG